MKGCCEDKSEVLAGLRVTQGRVLRLVLVLNAIMFVVELAAGWVAHSSALMADSLDMLGDATVYGFSLYVLVRSERWRAWAAILKGLLMACSGLAVFAHTVAHAFGGGAPEARGMGLIALLALAVNTVCLVLLVHHREDDVNMRSTWLCSRNDVLANVGVLLAAGAVALTHSRWPDLLVGGAIALVFLGSALPVLKDALSVLRRQRTLAHE